MLAKLLEVYERLKHLDPVLTLAVMTCGHYSEYADPRLLALRDLWLIVRESAESGEQWRGTLWTDKIVTAYPMTDGFCVLIWPDGHESVIEAKRLHAQFKRVEEEPR